MCGKNILKNSHRSQLQSFLQINLERTAQVISILMDRGQLVVLPFLVYYKPYHTRWTIYATF